MKTVISPKNHLTVFCNEVNSNLLYFAVSDDEVYFLKTEEGERWIFRQVNNLNLGHTGWHKTAREAVEQALTFGNTEVFEFDTMVEAAHWLISKGF